MLGNELIAPAPMPAGCRRGRTNRASRRSPVTNRARAWNHYGHAKWALDFARVALEAGDRLGAGFWTEKAIEAHRRGRAYQRRLVAQGGSFR